MSRLALHKLKLRLDVRSDETLTRAVLLFARDESAHQQASNGGVSVQALQPLELCGPADAAQRLQSMFVSIGDHLLNQSEYQTAVHEGSGGCRLVIHSPHLTQLAGGAELSVDFSRAAGRAEAAEERCFVQSVLGDSLNEIAFVPANAGPIHLVVELLADAAQEPRLLSSAPRSSAPRSSAPRSSAPRSSAPRSSEQQQRVPRQCSATFEQAALLPSDHLLLAAGSAVALRSAAARGRAGLAELLGEEGADGGERSDEDDIEFICPPTNKGGAEVDFWEQKSEWESWRAGIVEACREGAQDEEDDDEEQQQQQRGARGEGEPENGGERGLGGWFGKELGAEGGAGGGEAEGEGEGEEGEKGGRGYTPTAMAGTDRALLPGAPSH